MYVDCTLEFQYMQRATKTTTFVRWNVHFVSRQEKICCERSIMAVKYQYSLCDCDVSQRTIVCLTFTYNIWALFPSRSLASPTHMHTHTSERAQWWHNQICTVSGYCARTQYTKKCLVLYSNTSFTPFSDISISLYSLKCAQQNE